MTAVVMDSRARLIEAGYDELAFEAFYDMFVELLEALPKSAEAWRSSFLADNCADYYTWFMRLLTSCELRVLNFN